MQCEGVTIVCGVMCDMCGVQNGVVDMRCVVMMMLCCVGGVGCVDMCCSVGWCGVCVCCV